LYGKGFKGSEQERLYGQKLEHQSPGISERELADKIIYLHDVLGLGFRRIAKELGISKDMAFRVYHKYKPAQKVNTEQEIADKETKLLDQDIKEREQNVHRAKIKHEKRKQIAILTVQEAEVSLEHRRELFEDKVALLEFAQNVLPHINPALWLQLVDFCSKKNIDLENGIHEAIGLQSDYEEIRKDAQRENRAYFLDEYLQMQIEEWLSQQQNEELEKETEDSGNNTQNVIVQVAEDPKEYVRIPLALNPGEWVDKKGIFHILLPRN
jgi:hypothetical protein